MTLPVAQKIFKKEGKVSMVEIAALCKNCPISDIVTQISGIIPTGKVTAVQQVVAGRMDALNHFQKFSLWNLGTCVARWRYGCFRYHDGER